MPFLSYLNLRNLSIPPAAAPKKFNLIDLIVLASYYLFSSLLLLSLFGLFKKEFLIVTMAAGFLLFLIFFRGKVEFKKHYLYFFILIPILFTGILLIRGAVGGDAISYYLPWAREIVLQGRMPDFLFNTTHWLTSREPLVPLFFAGIFTLFGFSDWLVFILPFFFVAAAVFLIYLWLLEKGVKKEYIIFGILLLLTNPLFLDRAGTPMQEPFILFFFTAFFYYWEKFQKSDKGFHLLLIFLSAVLAAVSKFPGFFLFLPLAWILIKSIKNKQFRKQYLYLFLIFPSLLWLLRNYLIYDNPFFPFLNEIFGGRYYDLVLTVYQITESFDLFFRADVLTIITRTPFSLIILLFSPLAILSFYAFWKKRKIQYISLFFILLLAILLMTGNTDYIRYLMPFLGVFIVYALIGLQEAKSRIFLSFIFFLSLWGLLSTKISLSQSQFFSPVEEMLSSLRIVSQLVYDYRLMIALFLGLFFYFLIALRRERAKYLIFLLASFYSVKTHGFNLGSWLNIWPPILGLIFIILIWRVAMRIKEETVFKIAIACTLFPLLLNALGLAAVYSLAHGEIVFPNVAEEYGPLPFAAEEIQKLEGENKDFYIYVSGSPYFTWYHNFKTVSSRTFNFHVITNLEYKESLSASEIHGLFKRSKIKYVVDNHYFSALQPFFDKIKSQPNLFKPIFQKEGVYLWQVKQ